MSTNTPGTTPEQEKIEELLRSTEREGIEDLINYLRKSDFYFAPASTRYHGCYDGGLADHVLNVYASIMYLHTNLIDTSEFNLPTIDPGSLIITALMHDLCKANTYNPSFRNEKVYSENGSKSDPGGNFDWESKQSYTKKPKLPLGHAPKSNFILQQFIKLTVDEAMAIHWHMGGFDLSIYNSSNELSQAWDSSLLAFLLHQADMLATYVMENGNYILTTT